MMYRWIVSRIVRRTWARIDAEGPAAAVAQAHPDMAFRFVGDTILGASLQGRDQFARWFDETVRILPSLRFTVRDVVVKGWPWSTTAAVRLDIGATLGDGSIYENEAVQWVRIRWGRLVDDWVLEDTLALERALKIQMASAAA